MRDKITNINTPEQPERQSLGERVYYRRQGRGLSVRGLAAQAKVDATWLSRVEHDVYSSPDPRSLLKLARALDIDVEDLYLDAGYSDGRRLPGFATYLRAKYDLPDSEIAQLEAHFQLINDKYHNKKGDTS